MSKIPNIPGIPLIPKVPLLNFFFKEKKPQSNNFHIICLENLKCLNLKELPISSSKKSIFSDNLNILLDEVQLEEFFKIPENVPRKESVDNSQKKEAPLIEKSFSISTLIDKNRFTAICKFYY
jgi:hypothetical protein